MQSIKPQLMNSPNFRKMLARNSKDLGKGKRAYQVDLARMFKVMDGICHALIFRKYCRALPVEDFRVWHEFLNFMPANTETIAHRSVWLKNFEELAAENVWALSKEIADKTTEEIYAYKIFAPLDLEAFITVEHTFYGNFNFAFDTRSNQ